MTAETTPQNRTRVGLTISKDVMTASVVIRAPQDNEEPLTVDEVLEELQKGGVVFGIDHAAVSKAVDELNFNNPVEVASGRPPKRGINSEFTFHFDTSANHRPHEDANGHIDYKDINFIQNVEAEVVLVTKTPPTPGEAGMSVRGKEIKATDGRDIPFNHGPNTEVSENGLSLKASKAGAIQYSGGKVSVMDVITISGDVDHAVGNIDCRGSVRVTGGIKAGFTLKVDGDLEVNGNVEDAEIHVKGNIMVKGGFFGEGDGVMEADGDITLKYAEGQRLMAGNDIRIGGEIINCQVEAGERVEVEGRRGKIIGGSVRARREIKAAILGSDAGTITDLRVGYDAELIRRHQEVLAEIERLHEDEQRVEDGLYVLYRIQMETTLPPDKLEALKKLEEFKEALPQNLRELEHEKEQVEEALKEYSEAEIICNDLLYPGVKASFGIVYMDVLEEFKECRMYLADGLVKLASLREKPEST